jgi:hypothetical protein
MSSDQIEAWLTPISEQFPCGQDDASAEYLDGQFDLRWEELLRELKSHRFSADEVAPEGGSGTSGPERAGELSLPLSAGTKTFIKEQLTEAETCFSKQCKSLNLAIRLPLLMMLREETPSGFCRGLKILLEIFQKFRDETGDRRLFPRELDSLRKRTKGSYYYTQDDRNHFQLFTRLLLDGIPLYKVNSDPQMFRQWIKSIPAEGLRSLRDALREAAELAEKAQETFTDWISWRADEPEESREKAEEARLFDPGFSEQLRKLAEDIQREAIAGNTGFRELYQQEQSQELNRPGQPLAGTGGAATGGALSVSGQIQSQEQALLLLNKVADYFAITQPHSPISYSLRQTCQWADLKLPELWLKLFDGGSANLDDLAKRIGFDIPKADTPEG